MDLVGESIGHQNTGSQKWKAVHAWISAGRMEGMELKEEVIKYKLGDIDLSLWIWYLKFFLSNWSESI